MSNNNSNDFAVVVNIHEAKMFALDAMLEEAQAEKQAYVMACLHQVWPRCAATMQRVWAMLRTTTTSLARATSASL